MILGTGTGLFGGSTAQTAFGTKPAAPLSFGTATSTAPALTFGQPSSQPLFGGATATSAAKPGLFGTNTTFGTAGFGTSGFGTNTGLTSGIGGGTTNSLFGSGQQSSSSFGATQPAAGSSGGSQLPIHQYILTLSEISQSSDHPLFRKMLEPSGKISSNTFHLLDYLFVVFHI